MNFSETSVLIEEQQPAKINEQRLKIIDTVFSGLVVAPLIIIYWSSTWNLFYYYILPNHYILGIVVTFIIANVIILSAYLIQDPLQKYHDKLKNGFALRSIYFYLLSTAYVGQWRGLYDLYVYFIDQINFFYGFGLSILAIVLLVFVVKRPLRLFTTISPFYMSPDLSKNACFVFNRVIHYEKNRQLEILLNYLNEEFNELALSIIIFKGFWGLLSDYLFVQFDNDTFVSIAVLLTCYFTYFTFCFLNLNNDTPFVMHANRSKFTINLVYFITYLVLIGIWAPTWYLYDKFVLNSSKKLVWLILTHFGTTLIMICLNLTSSLGGFGASSEHDDDETLVVKQFYEIRYFQK